MLVICDLFVKNKMDSVLITKEIQKQSKYERHVSSG